MDNLSLYFLSSGFCTSSWRCLKLFTGTGGTSRRRAAAWVVPLKRTSCRPVSLSTHRDAQRFVVHAASVLLITPKYGRRC